jgi:uncharacterized membrane protein HdeD (DUF308 family)
MAHGWTERMGLRSPQGAAPGAVVVEVALTPEAARRARRWLLAVGILALLAGAAAIVVPAVASVTMSVFVGVVLVVVSFFMAVNAWGAPTRLQVALRLVEASLAMVVGICLMAFPLTGALTLTFFLAVWFIGTGVLLLWGAMRLRGRPGWGLAALNGVVSLALGLLIALDLPSSAAWAVGLLVGINLLFFGVRALVAASTLKRTSQT